MKILRKTTHVIGKSLLADRTKEKAEKKELEKFKNINFVKENLHNTRNETRQTVKRKIQQMRKDKVFPQPKSYTNYNKRNGLLQKDKIIVNKL